MPPTTSGGAGRSWSKHGSAGKVVDAHPTWSGTTYTVEFEPKGKKHRGDTVTVVGVAEGDLAAE